MEEQKNSKRVLRMEIDDDVKHVSITGLGSDEKVVMRQELSEEELGLATGGDGKTCTFLCVGYDPNRCEHDIHFCYKDIDLIP